MVITVEGLSDLGATAATLSRVECRALQQPEGLNDLVARVRAHVCMTDLEVQPHWTGGIGEYKYSYLLTGAASVMEFHY